MRAKKTKLNHLHNMSIFEIVELMNEEDTTVARTIKKNLPDFQDAKNSFPPLTGDLTPVVEGNDKGKPKTLLTAK